MKYLIGLSIFQAALLMFLGVKVLGLETRTSELQRAVDSAATGSGKASFQESAYAATPPADVIRLILREELAAAASEAGVSETIAGAASRPRPSAPNPGVVSGEAAFAEERAVQRELDDFIFRGRMSEADMAAIQMKIGRLPPAERRRAMAKMIKAIDSGKLDAQL